jgi:hypothetical protein
MFLPAPIDKDFVPYTKRPVLKRNAGLFIYGAARGSFGARVVPQRTQAICKYPNQVCDSIVHADGTVENTCCTANLLCSKPC